MGAWPGAGAPLTIGHDPFVVVAWILGVARRVLYGDDGGCKAIDDAEAEIERRVLPFHRDVAGVHALAIEGEDAAVGTGLLPDGMVGEPIHNLEDVAGRSADDLSIHGGVVPQDQRPAGACEMHIARYRPGAGAIAALQDIQRAAGSDINRARTGNALKYSHYAVHGKDGAGIVYRAGKPKGAIARLQRAAIGDRIIAGLKEKRRAVVVGIDDARLVIDGHRGDAASRADGACAVQQAALQFEGGGGASGDDRVLAG